MNLTYTERFARLVTEIQRNIKRRKTDEHVRFAYNGVGYDLADRTQRMALIGQVAGDYVVAHDTMVEEVMRLWVAGGCKGKCPDIISRDTALLDRLANAILDEELTDNTSWKTHHEEYPFLSELQMARRTDGIHQRKYEGDSGEAKLSAAANIGTDGKSYNTPRRRERSNNENIFMDEGIRTRNKERKAAYEEFTKEQPVYTRMMTPEEKEAYGCL